MKDINSFLTEKETQSKKEKPLKKGRGADDELYVELMGRYKRARHGDKDKASEILAKAQKLASKGDVSKKAKIAGAYI